MRILYIHQYFRTPEQGGAIRSYYVATALAMAGHEVVVISSHNSPSYEYRQIEGFEVHFLPVYYSNELKPLSRSKAFLRFLSEARRQLKRLAPYDLCYISSTPLTVGLLGLYARLRLNTRYIFEVRDLWPEAPIQLGYLKNKALRFSLRKLEQLIYSKAEAVVALSPGMAKGVQQSQSEVAVHLVPNMADCHFFKPAPKNLALAQKLGLQDAFVISYLGAAGAANRLEYLLYAAQACQQNALPVKFLIAAEGARLGGLQEQAAAMALTNVVFTPYGSKEDVRNWLDISDAVYTCFAPYPILATNSPNKFFDGLAAGKLSIVNTAGWLKELVEKQRCGFYTPSAKPEKIVEQLQPFLRNPALLQEYQQNARRLAEEQFSREALSSKLVRLIEETHRRI